MVNSSVVLNLPRFEAHALNAGQLPGQFPPVKVILYSSLHKNVLRINMHTFVKEV